MKHYHNWHSYCADCGNTVHTNQDECDDCGAGSNGEEWMVGDRDAVGDPRYTTSAYEGGDSA